KRITEITSAARDVAKGTGDSQMDKATKAAEQVNSLAEDTILVRTHAQSKGWKELSDRLSEFSSELQLWRGMLVSFSNSEAKQNARARFADFTSWSTHYSTVRMTISTFFIGLAWGFVALKWDSYTPAARTAAWGLWILTGIFLLL